MTIPATRSAPEPAAAAPDLRAAWHEALAALGAVDGPDVYGLAAGLACVPEFPAERGDRRDGATRCKLTVQDLAGASTTYQRGQRRCPGWRGPGYGNQG